MLPILSPPVPRPERTAPHEALDLAHGTVAELVAAHLHLTYGANYNDPAAWNADTFFTRRESW